MVLGMATSSVESGAGGTPYSRTWLARGLNGVALVTSDAHTATFCMATDTAGRVLQYS
ncbi:MAG: hypothetical protein HHJ11_06740 [Phycicoccus sp.]|nr:hypothetical protein [Phycicoccus sp.]NMM35073.1 hypothetical protein [Phycicoccus sp.]